MTKEQTEDFFTNLTAMPDKFCEENDFRKNEHGVYLYKSDDGLSRMNLALVLASYKDFLIENNIVKEA